MFSNLRRFGFKVKQPLFTTAPSRQFSGSSEYVIPNREKAEIVAENSVGILPRILSVFHHNRVNCTDVTTKYYNVNKNGRQQAMFGIDFEGSLDDPKVNKILQELQSFSSVSISQNVPEVPWFPRRLADLNQMGTVLQNPDEEAGKNHPGFADPTYKLRRDEIAQSSLGYEMEKPIPYLKYTELENKTWAHIYKILRPLQEKYMCDSFNKSFEKMVKAGIVKPTEIPQIQDLNEFLIKETNFRLKPVTGILSQREFLNALALRTFCCTQYIRHHSVPEYTPEPDIIHEILGHIAMFADADFCDLSQEIGLFSLGNTAENVEKLGGLYWYTVEFGACKESDGIKGYGAGIASSIGEIKHFGENKGILKPLDPFNDLNLCFPIQTVQPVYYVAESFKDAGEMLIRYGQSLSRPFKAYFDHTTNAVEVDKKIKLVKTEEKPVDF